MEGTSDAIAAVREAVLRMAGSEYPVLISGESGVGKELVAREIHDGSAVASGPFIAVNCACIPEELSEAELFGAARGAFTGAQEDRQGIFDAANNGTLFLDEIEVLSPGVQGRLLRVLETGSFRRLGDIRTRRSRARIIAASNRDPAALVRDGFLRRDLYYRLNVLAIEVPPLRCRIEDIPILSDEFLRRASQETSRPPKRLSSEALQALQKYSWPGNVRELENAIRRAFLLSDRIELEVRDFAFLRDSGARSGSLREYARRVVAEGRRPLAHVARSLGVSRKTLWTWRKQWAGSPAG